MMQGTEDFDEIVVYGARGTGQTILQAWETVWNRRVRLRAAVDDFENGFDHPALGVPVISPEQRLARFASVPVMFTMGHGAARARIAARLAAENAVFATAVHRASGWIMPDLRVGAGSVVHPAARIGPNVVIGAGVQVHGEMLAHDVTIGDFCDIGLGTTLLGHVAIGAQVNIAPCAVIHNGTRTAPLTIGDGAVIGVGAVVNRNVAPSARMIGNPAMTLWEWKRLRQLIGSPDPDA